MKCKCCKKIEPDSRWNKRFGKHELCEKCLRTHEDFKYEYISRVIKQAGIKNMYGYLTVKVLPRDSKEIITIIEERPFDRTDFGILMNEIEYALEDDVLPDNPFGSRVLSISKNKELKSTINLYHVFCGDCLAKSMDYEEIDDAIVAWNRRSNRETD